MKKSVKNKRTLNGKNIIETSTDELKSITGPEVATLSRRLINDVEIVCVSNVHDKDSIKNAQNLSKAMMSSLAPQDGLQAMLATQMIAVHQLQMKCSKFAKHLENPENMKTYTNMAIKLANTFLNQANALSKLQGKNQQKVTVEHVNVEAGGQAIVGNIETNGGGGKNEQKK